MSQPRSRQASVTRKTNETDIEVTIDLDCAPGSGKAQTIEISTGIGFLDHVIKMQLQSLHSFINLYLYRCTMPLLSMVDYR